MADQAMKGTEAMVVALAVAMAAACSSGHAGAPVRMDAGPSDAGAPGLANVDPPVVERAPTELAAIALPAGTMAAVPWVGPEGAGVVVAQDGRFLAVDTYGTVTPLERLPGDPVGPGESPPVAVVERSPGEPLALVPSGALVLQGGWVRKAELPPLLSGARTMTRWGTEALWATSSGLYTTQGDQWFQLRRAGAAVTDVADLVAGAADPAHREAWVRGANGEVSRLEVTVGTGALQVTWSDPIPGEDLTHVRAVAGWSGDRFAARDLDLVRVTPDGRAVRVRIAGEFAGPDIMVPAGPWMWLAWVGDGGVGDVARLGTDRVEIVARGMDLHGARLAADPARGDAALVVTSAGVTRVLMEPALALQGLDDGATVTATRLPLGASPPDVSAVTSVEFILDNDPVVRVTTPPFGWGDSGALYRDLPALAFGDHTVQVVVHYQGAGNLQRTRGFHYASPLGRVPSYATDIAPVYALRCARCHSTGVARDLRGYDRLSAQSPLVAASVSDRTMPPDLEIDQQTITLFTAWVAGATPP